MSASGRLTTIRDADSANSDRYLAYFWQDGLGVPDRDYYLGDAEKLAEVRTYPQVTALINRIDWLGSFATYLVTAKGR